MKRKFIFIIIALAALSFFLLGCSQQQKNITDSNSETADQINWRDIELTDVVTGDIFKVSDHEGETILLESFAVWCPTCLQQQKQIDELKGTPGDAGFHISIDTDPNEDEQIVLGHIQRNNFEWSFAVPKIEFTRSLIEEIGIKVVNAPSAPVVLICENQSARLLPNGVKNPDSLRAEIVKGCENG